MKNFTRHLKKYKNKTIKKGGNKNGEEIQRKGIIDNLGDKLSEAADKTGAVIINNANEVLRSDTVKQTTKEAAKDTVEVVKEITEKVNEALEDL